jgi:hypothetical protein
LSAGSWLHEKPCQFDVTPGVVNAPADGAGVREEGSTEGEFAELDDVAGLD